MHVKQSDVSSGRTQNDFSVWQEKTAAALLRKRRMYRDDQVLQDAIRESLSLIGYMDPVKGHGIRVLSIDGGGTR